MIDVRDFLGEGLSREIKIRYHVSGARVSISEWEHGEVTWDTDSTIEGAIKKCIEKYNESIKRKISEKIERLESKKKDIEKELQKVSTSLNDIKLSFFKKG